MSNREIQASDFAGHCNELTAWRILSDITEGLLSLESPVSISPSDIIVTDRGGFRLQIADSQKPIANSKKAVWTLAASLYYVMMGRELAFGSEQAPQTATSRIPFLRSSMPELSALVARCLSFEPDKRPTLEELHKEAVTNLERLNKSLAGGPPIACYSVGSADNRQNSQKPIFDRQWPEKMQAIQ